MFEQIQKTLMDKTVWLTGALVGVISVVLTYVMSLINFPKIALTFSTINIDIRQQLEQGISPELGGKALSLIGGFIPVTVNGMIAVLLSAALTYVIGKILYETITALPRGKTAVQRIALTLLYGTVITAIILSMSLTAVALTTIITLAIYYAVIALILTLLEKQGIIKTA